MWYESDERKRFVESIKDEILRYSFYEGINYEDSLKTRMKLGQINKRNRDEIVKHDIYTALKQELSKKLSEKKLMRIYYNSELKKEVKKRYIQNFLNPKPEE